MTPVAEVLDWEMLQGAARTNRVFEIRGFLKFEVRKRK